jgi:hypothetical protein
MADYNLKRVNLTQLCVHKAMSPKTENTITVEYHKKSKSILRPSSSSKYSALVEYKKGLFKNNSMLHSIGTMGLIKINSKIKVGLGLFVSNKKWNTPVGDKLIVADSRDNQQNMLGENHNFIVKDTFFVAPKINGLAETNQSKLYWKNNMYLEDPDSRNHYKNTIWSISTLLRTMYVLKSKNQSKANVLVSVIPQFIVQKQTVLFHKEQRIWVEDPRALLKFGVDLEQRLMYQKKWNRNALVFELLSQFSLIQVSKNADYVAFQNKFRFSLGLGYLFGE